MNGGSHCNGWWRFAFGWHPFLQYVFSSCGFVPAAFCKSIAVEEHGLCYNYGNNQAPVRPPAAPMAPSRARMPVELASTASLSAFDTACTIASLNFRWTGTESRAGFSVIYIHRPHSHRGLHPHPLNCHPQLPQEERRRQKRWPNLNTLSVDH